MRPISELIVDVPWLSAHFEDPSLRVVDARNAELYDKGHISGALNLDIFELHWWDSTPEGLIGFRKQHSEALGALGIAREDTVVFYDDRSGMLAGRGVWALEVLGQERVAILDGGLGEWERLGLPVSTDPATRPPAAYTPTWSPESLAGINDVIDAVSGGGVNVLDTRTEEEYRGTRVRSKYGGTMPGVLHCDWENNLDAEGKFKSPEELKSMYGSLGLDQDVPVVAFCHGGYRSANTYLALRLAGYTAVRNYVSAWGEWGNRDDVPHVIPD